MTTYRTPGVYIEEISKLPASIAPVATAVPAFIGYVKSLGNYSANQPVRIESVLEFEQKFGAGFSEEYTVAIDDSGLSVSDPANWSTYLLYYHVQMYFANGGGAAWIIPVGTFAATANAATISNADLSSGLTAAEEVDEVTLLCIPEAVQLIEAQHKELNDDMLEQCNRLQDRFALLDVREDSNPVVVSTDSTSFRSNQVGTSYLKYGAAYYPSLHTTLAYSFDATDIDVTDSRSVKLPKDLTGKLNLLEFNPQNDVASTGTLIMPGSLAQQALSVLEITLGGTTETYTEGTDWNDAGNWADTVANLVAALAGSALVTVDSSDNVVHSISFSAATPGANSNNITIKYTSDVGGADTETDVTFTGGLNEGDYSRPDYYREALTQLQQRTLTLAPSGTIAGVYARVDNDRGVWKAPANVDVRKVTAPATLVTHAEQGALNIDTDAGKSINVIREFTGRGNLVWGARTLAGNDNEWRYVPVRRLFNFIEESVKNATEAMVFEPNDANTWLKVKAMTENFLTTLWRQGALQGATTQEAFFVAVGLGQTMTQDDILNGIMNVEIGIAAVRPAEFIVLKFSHFFPNS